MGLFAVVEVEVSYCDKLAVICLAMFDTKIAAENYAQSINSKDPDGYPVHVMECKSPESENVIDR
jgi:hypothetical protein